MACLLSSPCVVSSLSSSDWPRNIEDIFLFFPLFILSFFFFFPLRQREHHSLFSRSEREQLSVGGARSRWQVMNGQAGCKWQYADKPDHLQMDVGRWRVCGVGWWMEASEVRGRKKAECVCVDGGVLTLPGSFFFSKKEEVEVEAPAQQRASFVRADGSLQKTHSRGEYTPGNIDARLCWPLPTIHSGTLQNRKQEK